MKEHMPGSLSMRPLLETDVQDQINVMAKGPAPLGDGAKEHQDQSQKLVHTNITKL